MVRNTRLQGAQPATRVRVGRGSWQAVDNQASAIDITDAGLLALMDSAGFFYAVVSGTGHSRMRWTD